MKTAVRLELGRVTERQMSLEDHPFKTRRLPKNQAGELRDERAICLHGIRFLNECWQQSFWKAGACFHSPKFAGEARVKVNGYQIVFQADAMPTYVQPKES